MTDTAETNFIVMTARAKMPVRCFNSASYHRVAVLEVEVGAVPTMISARERGVVRVVATWERLFKGKTKRCAFERALAEAEQMATELNGAA